MTQPTVSQSSQGLAASQPHAIAAAPVYSCSLSEDRRKPTVGNFLPYSYSRTTRRLDLHVVLVVPRETVLVLKYSSYVVLVHG
eukprot:COSAG01_NODE_871_length_13024_cov_115.041925_10_plen_83_part_00